MKRWIGFAAVIAAAISAVTFANAAWDFETRRGFARLRAPKRNAATPGFSPDDLAGLPPPVRRYFEFALTPGQPLVQNARVRQRGTFAMRPDAWGPFTAVEHFSVSPPGFSWDSRMRILRILPLYVRDAYILGEGSLLAAVFALIPVGRVHATPSIAASELLRYLSETPLFPTALLAREGVAWTPIDDSSARATLVDGATTVACDVRFGDLGEIAQVCAMRDGIFNGVTLSKMWIGRWRDYRRTDGMMIPTSGEAEWIMPEGPQPYWRGRIIDAAYTLKAMP